jgi:hypothetical protein
MKALDLGLAVFVVTSVLAALSRPVENAIGLVVVAAILLVLAREFYDLVIVEWRKDRALVRELGGLTGPPPILLQDDPDTKPIVIPFGDPRYPAAMQANANGFARRPPPGEIRR